MADLKIPNINMNPDKYIFKKKLSSRRKSKRRLFIESAFMFIFSLFIVYINYLIPNKSLLIRNLPINLYKSYELFIDFFSKLFEIFLVVFIFSSSIISLVLVIGSLYRLLRIAKRKNKIMNYKRL